ncbi:MAG: hypothetical protein LRY39_00870 [Alphaproteobacteria bacterium]|nr:hypothetical protein [Alphaproteobacteria bacterium]
MLDISTFSGDKKYALSVTFNLRGDKYQTGLLRSTACLKKKQSFRNYSGKLCLNGLNKKGDY